MTRLAPQAAEEDGGRRAIGYKAIVSASLAAGRPFRGGSLDGRGLSRIIGMLPRRLSWTMLSAQKNFSMSMPIVEARSTPSSSFRKNPGAGGEGGGGHTGIRYTLVVLVGVVLRCWADVVMLCLALGCKRKQ